MIVTNLSKAVLSTLAASTFSTRMLVAATNYDISIGATPVTVNGFNEDNESAELTMQFTLADGDAGAGTTCNAYEVSGDQCNTDSAIPAIETTPFVAGNDVSVAVNIDLFNIASTAGYSYDPETKVGTFNFCTRCSTSDGLAGEVDYSEILATVTVTMESSAFAITADFQESAAVAVTQDAGAASYAMIAFQCDDAKVPDSSTIDQNGYIGVCVNFAQADVDCDHFESLTLGTFGMVESGSIVNTFITAGDDSASPSSDGICFLKTQFPASLVPSDGSVGAVSVAGSVVIRFGRRKLKVNFSTDKEEERALLTSNDEAIANFVFLASAQASMDNPLLEITNHGAANGASQSNPFDVSPSSTTNGAEKAALTLTLGIIFILLAVCCATEARRQIRSQAKVTQNPMLHTPNRELSTIV